MISSERSQAEVHTKLLDAFQLIVRVPSETLLAHRREAVLAFDKLRLVVSADTVPGADSPIEESSSRVLTLLQSLNRSQTEITEHLSLPEVNAVGECPELESKEPPIHNFDSANPTGSSSRGIFRKGLSLRRRALDYEKWELTNHGTSRVNILLQNVDQDQRSRDGYVNRFVKGTRISQSDQAAKKDVQHGIKMLVFERLYQRTAVSAVLIFACTRFRNLKFRDLPLLKTMLEKSPWISEILMQKERWYQRCQEHYDGSSTHSKMSSPANIPAAYRHKTKRPAELDMASEPNAKRLGVVDKGNNIHVLAQAAYLSSKHVHSPVTTSQISSQSHQIFPDSLSTIMSNEIPFAAAELPMDPLWTSLNSEFLVADWQDTFPTMICN